MQANAGWWSLSQIAAVAHRKLCFSGDDMKLHLIKALKMTQCVCVLHCGAADVCNYPKIIVDILNAVYNKLSVVLNKVLR